jgi:hypothetical protein
MGELDRTDGSRAWSTMPVHEDPSMTVFFHSSLSIIVDDGKSALFWKDRWLDGKGVADLASDVDATVP